MAAEHRPLTVYGLCGLGYDEHQAANLVGLIEEGLDPAGSGWTFRELRHLLFLRHRVRRGEFEEGKGVGLPELLG